jgi:hypothetical protein
MLTSNLEKECERLKEQNKEFQHYRKPSIVFIVFFAGLSIAYLGSTGDANSTMDYITESQSKIKRVRKNTIRKNSTRSDNV